MQRHEPGDRAVVLSSLLTAREVATRLQISERTVDRMLARGDLAFVAIGGRRLIEDAEVAAFVSRSRRRRTGAAAR